MLLDGDMVYQENQENYFKDIPGGQKYWMGYYFEITTKKKESKFISRKSIHYKLVRVTTPSIRQKYSNGIISP